MGVRGAFRSLKFIFAQLTRARPPSLRHYVGVIRADTLNARLEEIFSSVHTHGFAPLKFEAHPKDGGVFVRFRYTPGPGTEADVRDALKDIRFALEKEAAKRGGIPNWIGLKTGGIWLVKGKPWNEVRRT